MYNYYRKCCLTHNSLEFLQSEIPVFVNRLVAEESIIPYDYDAFDFCKPAEDIKAPSENLGQVLFGERIKPSAYKVKYHDMQHSMGCDWFPKYEITWSIP